MESPARLSDRVWTVPNAISFARLAAIPYFVYLLVGRDDPKAAGLLLIVIGATDWVDGALARWLHQESELGRKLDPIADRLAIVAAVVAGWIADVVPGLIAGPLLLREALMAVLTAWLVIRGKGTLQVRYLGKVATAAVYGSIPSFYLAAADVLPAVSRALGWTAGVIGLALYWLTAAQYAGDARRLPHAPAGTTG